jgi:hypothetical protein
LLEQAGTNDAVPLPRARPKIVIQRTSQAPAAAPAAAPKAAPKPNQPAPNTQKQ